MKWKTIFIVLAALILIVVIFHAFGVGGGKLITVDRGEVFTIVLQTNPSTGYEWNAEYDREKICLESTDFAPYDSQRLGSSGVRSFVFKGIKQGVTKIEFIYKRSFEKGNDSDKKLYKIFVK